MCSGKALTDARASILRSRFNEARAVCSGKDSWIAAYLTSPDELQ